MDWYLDPGQPLAARRLRMQFRAYLERHAGPGSDVDAAHLVFAEALSNAAEHSAGPIWVSVEWSQEHPELVVHDLGAGFVLDPHLPADELAERGRGLFLVSELTTKLEVAAKRAGGSVVRAQLPVARQEEESHDPPRRLDQGLPPAEDARDDGTFDRESFLRALVVELAQEVEFKEGPAAAEAAVAQVGTNVGGRMEDEYRRARAIVDALTPEQMADLYVRLKRGIGGDFYVVEANEERIVLGNRACPFGPVVQRAPALCRMTSSVFGGIASRNGGHAVVQLEERIAVGDPECRVVVWLDAGDADRPGHHYRRGAAATPA